MYDLPRRIHEYTCINCGERFWMEMEPPPAVSLQSERPPIHDGARESAEHRSAQKAAERPGWDSPGDLGLLAANN
ncbi:MAG: hypothetical protein HY319_23845 [Armatimonadetes bacterium]|nr:hypothetical protein [Armatimonadota bacterium]